MTRLHAGYMDSSTCTVASPECGQPATVSMHTLDEHRFEFQFDCPNGHQVHDPQAQELWIAAHQ